MYRQTVGSFTIGDVSVLDGTSVVSQIRTQKAALESQKRDSYSNIEMDKKEGVIWSWKLRERTKGLIINIIMLIFF